MVLEIKPLFPPDFCFEQAPTGAHGRSDSQSFPYLQRLNHPATAAEGAHEWYVFFIKIQLDLDPCRVEWNTRRTN